ncbi:hypothetical protein XELAEV_18047712mg [Xenopus laevis]|uniref:Uncharacterized protein n=1 Tax=Xenopus laevis TaxID=8355 RepID=A0A974H1N6_XENLA|nr:hypothetical protein XELAEV_18047712mg [Xenopus laevis]
MFLWTYRVGLPAVYIISTHSICIIGKLSSITQSGGQHCQNFLHDITDDITAPESTLRCSKLLSIQKHSIIQFLTHNADQLNRLMGSSNHSH